MQFSGRKAEHLIGAARAVATGELALAQLGELAGCARASRAAALPGIGPWTIGVRAHARRSVSPTACRSATPDSSRRSSASTGFDDATRRGAHARADGAFAPQRSLAIEHFWQSLSDAGARQGRMNMQDQVTRDVTELSFDVMSDAHRQGHVCTSRRRRAVQIDFGDSRRRTRAQSRCRRLRAVRGGSSRSTSPASGASSSWRCVRAARSSSSRCGSALLEIPFGATASYGEIAQEARARHLAARRRHGERREPDSDRDPVSSRDRRRRLAHRLRRRARHQGRSCCASRMRRDRCSRPERPAGPSLPELRHRIVPFDPHARRKSVETESHGTWRRQAVTY